MVSPTANVNLLETMGVKAADVPDVFLGSWNKDS